MESETARIPVRSERQAMDWSLVLASQGLETEIERGEHGSGWALRVPRRDCERALRALRQYHVENRGWPWQQPVPHAGILFDWGSALWALLTVLIYWLSGDTKAVAAGLMDSNAVASGQWWRLFTAVWLHADLAHLAGNLVLGFVLLGLVMGRYGTGVGLLAAYLCGVGGNGFAALLSPPPHRGLGSSGLVMGALGLLVAQSVGRWRPSGATGKLIISSLSGGILLFVLLAVSPEADVLAHLGGFLSGVVLAILLNCGPSLALKPGVNLAGAVLFSLLVLLPWWLALHATWPITR